MKKIIFILLALFGISAYSQNTEILRFGISNLDGKDKAIEYAAKILARVDSGYHFVKEVEHPHAGHVYFRFESGDKYILADYNFSRGKYGLSELKGLFNEVEAIWREYVQPDASSDQLKSGGYIKGPGYTYSGISGTWYTIDTDKGKYEYRFFVSSLGSKEDKYGIVGKIK